MRVIAAVCVSLGSVLCIASASPAARSAGALSPAPILLTYSARSAGYTSSCLARADGTQRRRFVRLAAQRVVSRVSWSPKGKYAALIRTVRRGSELQADLVVTDQHGRTLRHLVRDFQYPPEDPVWSPDGRWIAVEGGGHGGSLGVVPSRGGAWREVVNTGDLASGLNSPTWTPDSRRLTFAIQWANSPPNVLRVSGIYDIGIDGSGLRKLVPNAWMPAYSSDGSQLAYVRSPGQYQGGEIWVSNGDGTNPRRLTESAADARPAWSPRGRLIAFQRTIAGHTSIRAVSPDGSAERVLVSSRRYEATLPSWRPPAPFRGGPQRPCP